MIEFELDIPSLTQQEIQLEEEDEEEDEEGEEEPREPFINVRELQSWSKIDGQIMIEILILLIDSFDRRVSICETR